VYSKDTHTLLHKSPHNQHDWLQVTQFP